MTGLEVLVVAGEASGDQHGADVVRALLAKRPDVKCFGMGGTKLQAAGLECVYASSELSVMGVTEVLPKLGRILEIMKGLERLAAERRPRVALLIDSPDFNLRLAARLKRLGVRVAYYVSPMVWAWRPSRVKTIARVVDRLLCILPFEPKFYEGSGVDARYVGNPVVAQLPAPAAPEHFKQALGLGDAPVLALLPGSRRSELKRLLPVMAESARALHAKHPELQIAVPVAPSLDAAPIRAALDGLPVHLFEGRAPEVMGASHVGIVASGTATLEAGLMGRPFVSIYRVSATTYAIGRMLVKLPFFTLVNLLLEQRAVPELLQGDVTRERVVAEVDALWAGTAREACVQSLARLRAVLGDARASEHVVAAIEELAH